MKKQVFWGLILAMTVSFAAEARPTTSGKSGRVHTSQGAARGHNGSVTGAQGSTVQGAGGRVVVPGKGTARAGAHQATGKNGGTAQAQGASVRTKQGGFHQNSGSWNGKNSTGSANSSGSWKAGQGGQSATSVEATSKKTGQTYSADGQTEYHPETGGSTTVTGGNGTTKTVTYPAKTP